MSRILSKLKTHKNGNFGFKTASKKSAKNLWTDLSINNPRILARGGKPSFRQNFDKPSIEVSLVKS